LIVDDNSDVLAIVTELVSAAGYRAITASGGREAIEKAKAEMPNLMLLDINMPDIDGWSVLRSLKEEGLTSKIKVMMLTAYTDIGTDIFGLQDVVSGYIRKPFTNAELSEKIKEIVEGQETITIEPKMAIIPISPDRAKGNTGWHGKGQTDRKTLRTSKRLRLCGQRD
jgi:DNA-binding response OmpR family regulator